MLTALSKYRLRIAVALALLLLIAGTVWAVRHHRQEKQIQQITDKGQELADQTMQRMQLLVDQATKKAFSPTQFLTMQDDQREQFEELRKEIEKLPPEQRDRVRKEMGKTFFKQVDKMAADLLAKPKAQQDAILDAFINLMEMARNNPRFQQGNRRGMVDGGPPQNKNSTPEDRENRRKQFLDNTTPSERAHLSAAMQLLEQRRVARGLPPR